MIKLEKTSKEQKNKFAKYYFTPTSTGKSINWDAVDDSNNFDVIPTNSKGRILMSVGDLRTMIDDIATYYDLKIFQARCQELELLKSELYTDSGAMDTDDVESYINRRLPLGIRELNSPPAQFHCLCNPIHSSKEEHDHAK